MNSAFLHSVDEVLAELHALGHFADCSALVTDHRRLGGPRDVLLAVPGERFDPRNLADDLIRENRCGLVLVEHDAQRAYQSSHVVPVMNLRSMLAELAQRYYATHEKSPAVIAVTGTNGKTTVTRWLAQALNALGEQAAVIGTLGYGAPDALSPHSGLTTPDVVGVHHLLHELGRQGVRWVCIEASSIGLDQGRLERVALRCAAFTNLTQDHLDYHHTMQAYGEAKLILARWPGLPAAVVNQLDSFGEHFAAEATRGGARVYRLGAEPQVNAHAIRDLQVHAKGMQFELVGVDETVALNARIVGQFNAENLALVALVLQSCGFAWAAIQRAVGVVTPPPGRMQWVHDQPCVVVDYAHTPEALRGVINTLKPLATQAGGRLLTLFGCGGDRDRSKRPQMGQIAASLSDAVWVTSDNPRGEVPESIIADILAGISDQDRGHVQTEVDRRAAIAQVLEAAHSNDVVLLAGKGHEQTQTIGSLTLAHCDAEIAKDLLSRRRAHA